MKKRNSLGIFLLTICLSTIMFSKESLAKNQTVRVTLPSFSINLNDNKVDNQYRDYPLLVYKDITYIPMTWYDCRLLGLKTEWTEKEGLKISQEKVTSSYVPYKTNSKNSNSYNAKVPNFKISVNGKIVDNSKEQYPLLNFKDITYFPLTWKFAHDEFGWDYEWNESKGLNIKSTNPQVKTVNLPKYAGENAVALFKGYYYFVETVGNTNNIYRVLENNTEKKELVHSYEVSTTYGFNNYMGFHLRDNQFWAYYHIGGASMGSDIYLRVSEDGKIIEKQTGYLDFKSNSKGTLRISHFAPPGGDNLWFVPNGQENENGKSVGNPNFLYGWHIERKENSMLASRDNSTTIINNEAYVLSSNYPTETGDLNRIYKINLDTNDMTKITNFEVKNFKIKNNKLYYIKDEDEYLYSSNIDGTNEKRLSNNKVNGWYDEVDGNIYYTVFKEDSKQNLYKVEVSPKDTLVLKESLESIQISNGKIICRLSDGEDYGINVFDSEGNLNLAITDKNLNMFVHDDKILIISAEDKSIKVIKY